MTRQGSPSSAVAADRPDRIGLGTCVFHVENARLVGADGSDVPLRPRSLAVLRALALRLGEIVCKDDLVAAAWPGPAVTDESVSQCIADIRRAIGDRDHTLLETFPKRGYRLNGSPPELRRPALAAWVAVLFLAVIAALGWRFHGAPQAATVAMEPARPSIAVLRFADDGGGLLARGFAEDLTIALTGLSGLDVIPSATALTQDPQREGLPGIAGALGARYLVDGSFRRRGDRLRVSVELVDGRSGHVAWAGRYDGRADDVFDFHDRALRELTEALSLTLSDDERARMTRRGTDSLAAYDELLLGRRALGQLRRDENLAAERHFRRALEIAPDYPEAHARLADTYVLRLENAWSTLPRADVRKARFYAHRAQALDPQLAYAAYVLGRLDAVTLDGDLDAAAGHLERAMRLAPGDDDARVFYAIVQLLAGEAEEALPILDDAIAGHPAPPFWYHFGRGHALFALGRTAEASEAFETCLWQMPTAPYCLRFQIAALGAQGRTEDARWAATEYEALGHEATVTAIMATILDRPPESRKRIREALLSTGIPSL